MNTRLSKVTQLPRTEFNGKSGWGSPKTKTSSQSNVHPYLQVGFWSHSRNHFWETGMYSEESKEYFRDSILRMAEKRLNTHVHV
jgi:hypothetical protein